MAVPDPNAMIRTHLADLSAVTAKVDTRIFGSQLPAAQAASMPRAAIVVIDAGGPGTVWDRTITHRLDIRCYGATPLAARELAWIVYTELAWLSRRTIGTGKLYALEPQMTPLPQVDPDTNWPSATVTFLATVSREPVAS